MGFNWATEGNPIRAAAAGKGSSQADEGQAKRFRPANGDEDCRSNPATVPDRSSPTRPYPPDARTMTTIPARTAAGSRCHAATTSARSGGTALDFTLVLCSIPGFSRVKPGSFESCPPSNHWPFPPEGNNCGESSRSGSRPRRGSPPEGSTSNTSGAPSNRLRRPRPSRL